MNESGFLVIAGAGVAGLMVAGFGLGKLIDHVVRLAGEKAALVAEREKLVEEIEELRRALERDYPRVVS